jgi:hypothetical protein
LIHGGTAYFATPDRPSMRGRGEAERTTTMSYVIDSSDNGMLDAVIEYANDDIDLLELAMVLLQQMELESADLECKPLHTEVEAGMRMLPMLAYTA